MHWKVAGALPYYIQPFRIAKFIRYPHFSVRPLLNFFPLRIMLWWTTKVAYQVSGQKGQSLASFGYTQCSGGTFGASALTPAPVGAFHPQVVGTFGASNPLYANPSFRSEGVGTFHACAPLHANLCLLFASCLHHRRQYPAPGRQPMLSPQVVSTIGVSAPLRFQSVPFARNVSALLAPAYPSPLWCRSVPFQAQGVGNIGSAPLQSVNSAQRLTHPKPQDAVGSLESLALQLRPVSPR